MPCLRGHCSLELIPRAGFYCIILSKHRMYLSLSVVVAILCIQSSVDGFKRTKVTTPATLGRFTVRNNQIKQERIPRSSSTELSAILPTVYSAIAVAAVIAFHEAGKGKEHSQEHS